MSIYFKRTLFFLLALIAFAFGIKNLKELDIWIFFKTGEWIWLHRSIPTSDVFSYTFLGQPWTHIKWGYSLLAYFLQRLAGPEFIMVLQGLVNMALVYLIYQIAIRINALKKRAKDFNPVLLILALIGFWISAEYRMNGRPEMFSHVFTLVFLFVYFKSKSRPKTLYVLIPVQLLWCNMHDGYVVGLVLMPIFFFSDLLDSYLKNKRFVFKRSMALTLGGIFLVSMINPLGYKSLLYAWEVYTQLNTNKYTPELFSCTFPEYWQQKEPIFLIIYLGIILFLVLKSKKIISILGFGYFVSLLFFLVLALNAHRNIIFFFLWSAPLILSGVFNKKAGSYQYVGSMLIGLVFYVLLVNNTLYTRIGSKSRFGLLYRQIDQPVKASEYLKEINVTEPVFSDYLSSSYLLWDQPHFKTFIDLRDLDVFSSAFFREYHRIMNNSVSFEYAQEKHGFSTCVLYVSDALPLHRYLYYNPAWKLIYIDCNTAIYSTRKELKPFINIADPGFEASTLSQNINSILNPWWKGDVKNKVRAVRVVAKYYEKMGDLNNASFILEASNQQN